MRLLSSLIRAAPLVLSRSLSSKLIVVSWNVNGIRSYFKHDPEVAVLRKLVSDHKVDVLCLQETKIQESHVDEVDMQLRAKLNVESSFWSCSRARKGYSGTATIVLRPHGLGVSDSQADKVVTYGIGEEAADMEGRSITLKSDRYNLVNVYVPNAGQALKRLDYRTNTWDEALRAHVTKLKSQQPTVPVIVVGDMNVAHRSIDYYNHLDKRTEKQAGTTPAEQLSFQRNLLDSLGLQDTFRALHPEASTYSYVSNRLGAARSSDRGMRIDYVLADPTHCTVVDAFIRPEINHPYSDHCPVGCELHFK